MAVLTSLDEEHLWLPLQRVTAGQYISHVCDSDCTLHPTAVSPVHPPQPAVTQYYTRGGTAVRVVSAGVLRHQVPHITRRLVPVNLLYPETESPEQTGHFLCNK